MTQEKKSGKDKNTRPKSNPQEKNQEGKEIAKTWAYVAGGSFILGFIFGLWSFSWIVMGAVVVGAYVFGYILDSAAGTIDKKIGLRSKAQKEKQGRKLNAENLTAAFIITSVLLVVLFGIEKFGFWEVPREYVMIISVGIFALSYFIKAKVFSKNKKVNSKSADE